MNTAELLEMTKTPEAYEEAQKQYNELLMRSATDLEFRQRLLTDPIAAIAEFNGHEVPEAARGLDIRFVENHGDVTIVLPDPVSVDGELTADELEAVAGGASVATLTVLSTAACASAVISAAAVIGIYKLAQ